MSLNREGRSKEVLFASSLPKNTEKPIIHNKEMIVFELLLLRSTDFLCRIPEMVCLQCLCRNKDSCKCHKTEYTHGRFKVHK